jgi:hypothetical protein
MAEASTAVQRAEEFLERRVDADISKCEAQRARIAEEVGEYVELRNALESLRAARDGQIAGAALARMQRRAHARAAHMVLCTGLKTQVDLGCGFFMQAKVDDNANYVLVDVGFGFFVEFTLDEALSFIAKKLEFLDRLAAPFGICDHARSHSLDSKEKLATDKLLDLKTHRRLMVEAISQLALPESLRAHGEQRSLDAVRDIVGPTWT